MSGARMTQEVARMEQRKVGKWIAQSENEEKMHVTAAVMMEEEARKAAFLPVLGSYPCHS